MIPDRTILDREFSSVAEFLSAADRELHGLNGAMADQWLKHGGARAAIPGHIGFSGDGGSGYADWPGEHPADKGSGLPDNQRAMHRVIEIIRQPGGSPKARERVRKHLSRNLQIARTRNPRRRMVWTGRPDGELSIDRLYSGRLDTAFRAPGVAAIPSAPRLKIGVQAGASHKATAEAMAARGAVCAAIAGEAYAAGCRVSLDWCALGKFYFPSRQKKHRIDRHYGLTVRLVSEGQPVDVDRIADVCASAYMFRALAIGLQSIYAENGISDSGAEGYDLFAGQAALDDPAGWLDMARRKLRSMAC